MNWYVRGGILSLACAALAIIGCGSASNNDQGISVTMLGYSVAAAASSTPGTGTATSGCSTAPNLSSGVFSIGSQTETSDSTPQVLAGVVVRNNLTTQFLRTESVFFEYFIPGAQVQPPTTAVPYGGVIAKAGGLQCGVVTVVPPAIISWISFNRESLPELPFLLIARGQVTGSASGGDVFTTNPVDIGFTVVTDVPITPEDGSVDSSGASEGEASTIDETDSNSGTDPEDTDGIPDADVDSGSDAQI